MRFLVFHLLMWALRGFLKQVEIMIIFYIIFSYIYVLGSSLEVTIPFWNWIISPISFPFILGQQMTKISTKKQ